MLKNRLNEESVVRKPIPLLLFRRSAILLGISILLFSSLLIRILWLQTAEYEKYQKKVTDQITTQSKVLADRGLIYDANGVPLATNITSYRVFLSPSSIANEQRERNKNGETIVLSETIAKELSGILGSSYDFILQETKRTGYLDRTLKKGVDEDTADAVREVIDRYGLQRLVYLEATDVRSYPMGNLASHVLGFTGSDGTGLYGLEYSYNHLLSGKNGKYITARDARGNEMPSEYAAYIKAQDGYNINTTLNVIVQSALEEALEKAYTEAQAKNRAGGIVMNVKTGEILGMAVYPSFNLNDPWTLDAQSQAKLEAAGLPAGSDEYSSLRRELLLSMWSNKTITESYIPGSTFKIMTASMALQEKVVRLDETFHCSGFRTVAGYQIHCHKRKGHGTLTFVQGIQQSCNPVLMETGLRIGGERFYQYLTLFGYLEKTGIDLPGEGKGLFIAKDRFTELDLAIYSFGQNFNVTMIQQITSVAAVANGGYLVTPHLVSSVTDNKGNVIQSFDTTVRRKVIESDICQTVSSILQGGVEGDGGARNAYVPGYRIAAKTGTSQKKNAGSIGKYVCSTVAYAPADDPEYAILIVVDEPTFGLLYGSTVAAPFVGEVMEKILPYLGVEPKYSEEELKNKTVTIPDCKSLSGKDAQKLCSQAFPGMKVEFVGNPDGVVSSQIPLPGTVVESFAARVVLYMDGAQESEVPELVTVPNLVGLTAAEANLMLVNAGLNVRICGTRNYGLGGVSVIAQSIEKGIIVTRGTVVEMIFRSLSDEDEDVLEQIELIISPGGEHETH